MLNVIFSFDIKFILYDKDILERTKDNLKDIKDIAGDKPDSSDAPDKVIVTYKNQLNTYGGYLEQKFGYVT